MAQFELGSHDGYIGILCEGHLNYYLSIHSLSNYLLSSYYSLVTVVDTSAIRGGAEGVLW